MELAHIAVAKLAVAEYEDNSIVPVLVAVGPEQRSCHPEVQEYGTCLFPASSGHWDDEILTVSPWLTEPPVVQRLLQSTDGDAVEYAGVEHVDATDPLPDCVVGQYSAEALDIWQFRHAVGVPRRRRPNRAVAARIRAGRTPVWSAVVSRSDLGAQKCWTSALDGR